jgi:hypothetical protein
MKHSYTIDQVSDFFREHAWEICGDWEEGVLESWVKWYESFGGLGLVWNGNELEGAAMAKTVNDPEETTEAEYSEHGEAIFVFLVAAKSKTAFRTLLLENMFKRFGKRLVIAFHRKKYCGRLRIHNWTDFMKKVS